MALERRFRHQGFSMVELTVSTLLTLALLTGVFAVYSQGRAATAGHEARARALLLAQELLEEMKAKAFEEPGGSGSFGRERGEGRKDRRKYDDVDDYDGYGPCDPPLEQDGSERSEMAGYSQELSVANVAAGDFGLAVANGTSGFKRLSVRIRCRLVEDCDVLLETIAARK